MADVVAREHGGDGHGDPPPGGWNPVSGCAASGPKKRGKTKNKKLLTIWEDKGSNPLPILFDFEDQATLRPVGTYAKNFKALLGVTLRQTVPLTYDSWDSVPREMRTALYPQLQTYFNIREYIGPTGIVDSFERGINRLCASLYSTAKYQFKTKHFTKLGGYDNVENVRQIVPENLDAQAWSDLVDFYIREDNMHRSRVNSDNRSNHHYPTHQGSKSFVEILHERRGTLSLIELFREKHTKKLPNGTTHIPDLALKHYEMMKKLLNDQQGVENPMTEDQILDQVLGKRRGFKRGRGHIVSGYKSSSSSPGASTSNPPGRVYTQAEVDALLKATLKKTKRETTILTKKVDIMADAMAKKGIDVVWDMVEESGSDSDSDSDSD